MKKIFNIIICFLPLAAFAQKIDRSKAPAPGKAPLIQVASPVKYTLPNGLKVYVVKNTKLPRVIASINFDLDGFKEGDKAGLADMAGQLIKRGTTTKTKEQIDEAVEYLGGSLSTSSTSAVAISLKSNFPTLFGLLSEVVLNPALNAEELEKVRKQTISGIETNKDDADAIADNVVKKLVYGANHPFGEIMTTKTVNSIKVEDVKAFVNNYWKPNIASLVFVGDIEPLDAKKLAEKYLSAWQKGSVPAQQFEKSPRPAKTYVAVVDRPSSVQSVVTIASPVQLVKGAPNDIPANVMNNILGGGFSGRLFANLREKHGFTYGAYSSLQSNKHVGIFKAEASVRNEKTDSSIQETLAEIKKIQSEKVEEEELGRMKNYLAGGFARSLENPSTIAGFALNIEKYNLPADYYQKYLTNLASVSATQVQDAATSLLQLAQMHIVIVGDAKQVAKGLEKYGEVKYFDVEGNEAVAPKEVKADASLTVDVLINKTVEAMGGKASIEKIKDVQLNGKVGVMGQSIDVVQKIIQPGSAVMLMSMGGMVISKQAVVDGKYEVSQQGMQAPITDDLKEGLDESAYLVPELMYQQKGYTLNIVGIEQVDGKDAIDVELTAPSGKKSHRFYDKETYLLVKTTKVEKGPQGPVTQQQYYKNYQKVDGVAFAKESVMDLGQFKMNLNFETIKVNQGLKLEDLK
ncbi:MAG: insulinase family protein [Chitinophagaceae bacterium]|jgi:zinc protease